MIGIAAYMRAYIRRVNVVYIYIYFYIFHSGILMNETSLQYASLGETINIECMLSNVILWQKFETQFILASCGDGSSVVNSTLTIRMSVSDTCHILTINNFTTEDVGMYRCFAIKDTKKAQQIINITLRCEYNSIID